MKRKLLATLLALCLIVGMIPVAASASSETNCPGGDTCTHAAAIGNTHYDTLQEAVEAVQDKGTITLLQDTKGSGIGTFKDGTSSGKIPVKNFTIDFATHTYTCIGPAVGSAGTQSQAFHLEWNGNAEDNVKVTLQNGTITSTANSGVMMLVQNYCDLILDNMTLDGSNIGSGQYTSSNNCGNVVIRDTTIIAPTNGVAFDVCDYASYTGVSVTVEGNSSIRGKVEVVNDNGDKNNASLSVKDGVFTTDVVGTSYEGATAPLTNYLAEDVTLVENSDGTFAVEPLTAENAVASVGTGENVNYYKTVAEAVENANNGTVTLLQNATFDTLPLSSGAVIVDLNGHTLTSTSGETSVIQKGANLTIQDSKGTGTLVYNGITDPAKAAFEVQVGSSISLKGIRYETSGTGVYAWGNATTVNIEDVDIDSSGYCVGTNAGETENYRVNINITNSQLTSALEGAGTAVLFNVPGTLNIDDSTLNGHWQGLIARGGNITISNSVITNTYDTLNTNYEEAWGSGNAVTLAGITIGNKGNNAYDYPVSIKLENTSVTSVGPNPAIYVYQMTGVNRKVTVAISGDSAVSGDFVVKKDSNVDRVNVTISGGYFTSDPSEYVAEGMAAVESDKEEYAYMVAKAGENPAKVVPADPSVDTNLNVSDKDEKELLDSIKTSLGATGDGSTPPSLDADSLNAAALTEANKNTTKVNDELVKELKEAIGEGTDLSINDVTIVIQPYMDIKVTDVNSDGDQKSFTLDITPMYRKVAVKNDDGNVPDDIVTREDAEGEGGSRVNAVVLENAVELPVKQPTEVVIPLPTGFTTGKTLYVLHDNRHYHQGAVESDVLTFTTEGFSPFTISTSAEMAAQIGDVYYGSLQDAVDNVQNGETVVLLKDQESATVDREVSFTISSQSGSSFTAAISAGAGYRNVGADNSYRFERIPSTPVNPGGDDDKPEEPAFPFTDVKSTAWYYNAVKYVYENNLMAGTGDTTFDPEVSLTRAMAAQLFYNLEGKPAVTGDSTFTDVTSGHWAVDAITWAAQNDIVAGIGGGLYDPDSNVTREQFAVMLYKYARFKGYDLTATGDLTQFPDAGSISSWAETALSWANGKGLINGHENGTIDPKGSTIRAQAASIMANFDQNVAK